jgi:hypothetical protein
MLKFVILKIINVKELVSKVQIQLHIHFIALNLSHF